MILIKQFGPAKAELSFRLVCYQFESPFFGEYVKNFGLE